MSPPALTALAKEVDGLERHPPVDLDGCPVAATLAPADAASLAPALGAVARAGLVAVPRGAGRHLALGNPPERADLFLSTARLAGIETLDPAEGVCRAEAGVPLGALREAAAAARVEIPIDGPDAATLGGAIAAASLGPRSHGFGRPRDAVLGLDVALSNGDATHCGGRVVKNVTGYDLPRLYTGSLGTLGVITAAWLRLRPAPEVVEVRERAYPDLEAAIPDAILASRRTTTRACALRADASGVALRVELGGEAKAVARDAQAIGGEAGQSGAVDAIAALQAGDTDGVRVRIAALPSELLAVAGALRDAGATLLVYPGLCVVYGLFSGDAADAGESALRAARVASGAMRIEAAPLAEKVRRCVFGAPPQEVALFRALKQRFDPGGALSRGRFAGNI